MGAYCDTHPKCLLSLGDMRLIDRLIQQLPPTERALIGRPNTLLLRHHLAKAHPTVRFLADHSPYHEVMGSLNPFYDLWKDGAWISSSDLISLDPLNPVAPEQPNAVLLYVLDPKNILSDETLYPLTAISPQGLHIEPGAAFHFCGLGYLSGPLMAVHAPRTLSDYLRFLLERAYPVFLKRCPWRMFNINTPHDWATQRILLRHASDR